MRGLPDDGTGGYITVVPPGRGVQTDENMICRQPDAENRQGVRSPATYRIVWMSRVLRKREIKIAAGSAGVATQWSVVDIAISCVLCTDS